MELKNKLKNRRDILKMAGVALVGGLASKAAAQEACGLTPPQTRGPFYPGDSKFERITDLTILPGKKVRAEGQVVYVKGIVTGADCKPVKNANVEIWQACHSGKYNHASDPNPAKLDPNFRYWGEAFTTDNGEYLFKTIIPGAYPADKNWTRPPHIHFRIAALGYTELVTQMYFAGDELNDEDLILNNLTEEDREKVIVDFEDADSNFEPGSLVGQFDIAIKPIRRR
jgi:protocatechuate 3,4-dioxygenase beta subunit